MSNPLQELQKYEAVFLDTLSVLEKHLDRMIVVGGWCPFLYAKYLWECPLQEIPRTFDLDLGVRETGSLRFDPTVYRRLTQAGFKTESYYEEEPKQVEFLYEKGGVRMKVEFITSYEVSDDTLDRFLGPQVAYHRIEGFEFLLQARPIALELPHRGGKLSVRVLDPAAYLIHKGLTFTGRSGQEKRDKDLLHIYFILRHCPQRDRLLDGMEAYRGGEHFKLFRENMLEHFGAIESPGYGTVARQLIPQVSPREVYALLERTFQPLLQKIKN